MDTIQPLSPCFRISRVAGMSEAMTGRPAAIASSITWGLPSSCRLSVDQPRAEAKPFAAQFIGAHRTMIDDLRYGKRFLHRTEQVKFVVFPNISFPQLNNGPTFFSVRRVTAIHLHGLFLRLSFNIKPFFIYAVRNGSYFCDISNRFSSSGTIQSAFGAMMHFLLWITALSK